MVNHEIPIPKIILDKMKKEEVVNFEYVNSAGSIFDDDEENKQSAKINKKNSIEDEVISNHVKDNEQKEILLTKTGHIERKNDKLQSNKTIALTGFQSCSYEEKMKQITKISINKFSLDLIT